MKTQYTIALSLLAGAVLMPSTATAQQTSLKQQMVGTWSIASVSVERKDGTRFDPWDGQAKGVLIFTNDGHFALVNTRIGRAKFASSNRLQGTPEENKATVQGSLAYFGTYTVDEAAKTYTVQIQASSYPNDEGATQTRPFTISGNEMSFTNPAATVGGGAAHVTLRRTTAATVGMSPGK